MFSSLFIRFDSRLRRYLRKSIYILPAVPYVSGGKSMIPVRPNYRRPIWLGLLLGLFALFLLPKAPAVLATDFVLDWSEIGFTDGASSLQTFENISDSGVTMTTEFRVLDNLFDDEEWGLYIPPDGQIKPDVSGTALALRDISSTAYPNAGYIHVRITFSQDIKINNLWMEPFYHWVEPARNIDVLKHTALQAFDAYGDSIVPISWQIYGDSLDPSQISDLIAEPHPGNGKDWLRSDYDLGQNTWSGAYGINYGNQPIRELHWYSWGYDTDTGELSNLLGSTYLGSFQFSTFPTAVTLVSVGAADRSAALGSILLVVFLFSLVTLAIMHRRPLPAVS
jgi:hypothetical protein